MPFQIQQGPITAIVRSFWVGAREQAGNPKRLLMLAHWHPMSPHVSTVHFSHTRPWGNPDTLWLFVGDGTEARTILDRFSVQVFWFHASRLVGWSPPFSAFADALGQHCTTWCRLSMSDAVAKFPNAGAEFWVQRRCFQVRPGHVFVVQIVLT